MNRQRLVRSTTRRDYSKFNSVGTTFDFLEGQNQVAMTGVDGKPDGEEVISEELSDDLSELDEDKLDELVRAEEEKVKKLQIAKEKSEKIEKSRMLREQSRRLSISSSKEGPTRASQTADGANSHPTVAGQPVGAKVAALIAGHQQNVLPIETDDDSSSSDDSRLSTRKKRRGKTSSGLHDTNKSFVRQKQKFPHASLQSEFLGRNKAPAYNDLNLALFVAGELEIILNSNVSQQEVLARLDMLRITAYRADYTEFGTLRELHCSVLRKIENGFANWGSDFTALERQVLESRSARGDKVYPKKKERFDKRPETKLYCRFFNRDGCEHTEFSHSALLYGVEKTVYHFCSRCWDGGKGEQLKHSASSKDCPNFI